MPGILANNVSSLPRPTFWPGLNLVPRCRTMIEPPLTSCPPKTFTPSRCAFESRPFLELPRPFLCAIDSSLLHRDLIDGQLCVVLPVTVSPLVLLFTLELENDKLHATAFAADGRTHPCIRNGVAQQELPVVVGHCLDSGAAQLQLLANLVPDRLDADFFARSNPV